MYTVITMLNRWLMHPLQVLVVCAALTALAVTWDGSLYHFFSLKQSSQELDMNISQIKLATTQLENQILNSKSRNFIERQAREKLDLLAEDEMVFVFSE